MAPFHDATAKSAHAANEIVIGKAASANSGVDPFGIFGKVHQVVVLVCNVVCFGTNQPCLPTQLVVMSKEAVDVMLQLLHDVDVQVIGATVDDIKYRHHAFESSNPMSVSL